jgi:hypothetical protein
MARAMAHQNERGQTLGVYSLGSNFFIKYGAPQQKQHGTISMSPSTIATNGSSNTSTTFYHSPQFFATPLSTAIGISFNKSPTQ